VRAQAATSEPALTTGAQVPSLSDSPVQLRKVIRRSQAKNTHAALDGPK
jgi:hypothetical protein